MSDSKLNSLLERFARRDRLALARLITLVENRAAEVGAVMEQIYGRTGHAYIVGVTGAPGAGKSTLVNRLIAKYRAQGKLVAVLAIDPSSPFSGGAVLGDRVRMTDHYRDPGVYIRSLSTRGHHGGLSRAAREIVKLLDAFGHDIIIIETVGVGQSEVTVANMVDTFVLLTLARSGDQLQGIKKGALELADIVVVNKADGEHLAEARVAARELSSAIRLIHPRETLWRPPVLTMSAVEGTGLEELWETIERHRRVLTEAGEFEARRRAQQVDWTWQMVRDTVLDRVLTNPKVRKMRADIERQVKAGELTPALAAQQILSAASE
jgi:LAO/AO transport system kinase